jgi:hypothetical protein
MNCFFCKTTLTLQEKEDFTNQLKSCCWRDCRNFWTPVFILPWWFVNIMTNFFQRYPYWVLDLIMVFFYPIIIWKFKNTESMIKKFVLLLLPFVINLFLICESTSSNEGEELQILYRADNILIRMYFIFAMTVVGGIIPN